METSKAVSALAPRFQVGGEVGGGRREAEASGGCGRYPFPRPHSPEAVLLPEATLPEASSAGPRLSRRQIFELVVHPGAKEWPVPARTEQSLRVLLSGGWVIKTRPAHRHSDLRYQRILLEETAQLTRRLGIWHPAKEWFLLDAQGEYWLCNATPRLSTHRDLETRTQKVAFWCLQTLMTVGVFLQERVTIDPKTRNFGFDGGLGRFFYLDDEVYRYDGMSAILLGEVVTLPLRNLPPARLAREGGGGSA